jgi:ADP-heptose:LPS heptosyltransferase
MRYTVGMRNPLALLRLAGEIRRYRPDVLVSFMPLRPLKAVGRDRLFFRLAGVRRFYGLPDQDGLVHRFDRTTGLYESEASRLARTLTTLGDAGENDLANWDLRLTPEEIEKADSILAVFSGGPYIVCAPGCKRPVNDWERENWEQLLTRLSARFPGYGLLLSGAREDAPVCDFAGRNWSGKKLNLAGQLTPRESAAVFRRAQLFLGPDSGPKHLAAAVRVPSVCVFSARGLPGVWFPPGEGNFVVRHHPPCFGCNLEVCTELDKQCIRSITVDEVEQAALSVLGRTLLQPVV